MPATSLRKYVWEGIIERIDETSVWVRMVQTEPAERARTTDWWPHGLTEEYTTFQRSMFSDQDNAEMFEGVYFQWELTQHLHLVRTEKGAAGE